VTAARPSGPYRTIVRAGPFYICSGQIGLQSGELVAGGVVAELHQAVQNLSAALFEVGLSLEDVVKTTVFLTDIGDFDEMNGAYAELFREPRPSRSAIGVAGLPRGASVEIEAWALARSSGFGQDEDGTVSTL
jgi:2-iminobutanoate/2-iminopropanoate deaminase